MAWDSIAYYQSRTGTTTFTSVTGLADAGIHTVNGADVTVPERYTQVIATMATLSNGTDTITGAQLVSPSLRSQGTLIDVPILRKILANAAFTPGFPLQVNMFLNGVQAPRNLTPGEPLNLLVRSDGATGANLISGVVLLGDGNYSNPYAGQPVETVEFLTVTAAVANTWTTQALTTAQGLRAGRYAVVGMESKGTTGKCSRLIFKEGASGRPGVFPYDGAVAGHGIPMFRLGNMGVYGEFTHTQLPSTEIFATGTDAGALTFTYLDLVKIG